MLKVVGAASLLLGILFIFGAFGNRDTSMFLLEILFGPILIHFGLELLR